MLVTRWLVVCSLLGVGIAQEWRQLPATAHPPVDGRVGMAFDPIRQRTVCCVSETVLTTPWFAQGRTTTWEWDGTRWLARRPATALPSLADQPALAWDATRQRVVLTNGNGELWAFDGLDWQLVFGGTVMFREPSLVFDSTRNVLVCADRGALYEEQSGHWVQRASFVPLAYEGTRIAFDAASGSVIAFGGWNAVAMCATTWRWDGIALTQLAPPTSPSGRSEHAMVVDPATQQVLLCGGTDYFTHQGFADAYAWTGTTWNALSPMPEARAKHAAAAFAGDVLVFGGEVATPAGASPRSHELLRRSAGTFTRRHQPAPGALTAFDPMRSRSVSVSGDATLESDGFAWTDLGVTPPPQLIALAGHFGPAGIVGIDTNGATWHFDGITWFAATPPGPQPSARHATALAHDVLRNRVVMFGGVAGTTDLDDVWEWDGIAWSNATPSMSPPAGRASLAWDALAQRLVLVPGVTLATTSTYTWDGVAWTAIAPTPRGYQQTRLAGHPTAGVVMVATTPQTFSVAEHTWLLTGTTWTALPIVDERFVPGSLVFDANRGEVVLHDGGQRRAWILSLQTAAATPAGAGCAGSNGVPELVAANLPQLGTAVRTDLSAAAPSSVALLLADVVGASVALPGGCTQLVANPIVLTAMPTNAAGFASGTWTIPANRAVRGIVVHTQALTLDPNGALFGFASLTAALQLRAGD